MVESNDMMVTYFPRWSNTTYGCDAVYAVIKAGDIGTDEDAEYNTNYCFPVLVSVNLVVMLVSYSLVFWQTWSYTNQPGHKKSSHTTMLVLLSLTYAVCVVPAMLTSWGLWKMEDKKEEVGMKYRPLTSICTSLYWCMYGELIINRPGVAGAVLQTAS